MLATQPHYIYYFRAKKVSSSYNRLNVSGKPCNFHFGINFAHITHQHLTSSKTSKFLGICLFSCYALYKTEIQPGRLAWHVHAQSLSTTQSTKFWVEILLLEYCRKSIHFIWITVQYHAFSNQMKSISGKKFVSFVSRHTGDWSAIIKTYHGMV